MRHHDGSRKGAGPFRPYKALSKFPTNAVEKAAQSVANGLSSDIQLLTIQHKLLGEREFQDQGTNKLKDVLGDINRQNAGLTYKVGPFIHQSFREIQLYPPK